MQISLVQSELRVLSLEQSYNNTPREEHLSPAPIVIPGSSPHMQLSLELVSPNAHMMTGLEPYTLSHT